MAQKFPRKSQVQICARTPACILGYFRPIWERYI